MKVVSSLYLTGTTPSIVGGTGCQLKLFPSLPNTTKSKRGYLYCPGFNQANGQRLCLVANGNFQSTMPVQVGLYAAKTPDDPRSIIALGTEAFQAGTTPWMVSAEMAGDSQSGIVQINYCIQSLELGEQKRAFIHNVDFAVEVPFVLAVGVTFSFSAAKNKAAMYQNDLLQG